MKKLSIGRKNAKKADILLEEDTVSSIHAYLYFLDGNAFIEDNASTNGTYIDSNGKIEKVVKRRVLHRDILHFGSYRSTIDELLALSNSKVKEKKRKQSCSECGMVIVKDETCSYCGHK